LKKYRIVVLERIEVITLQQPSDEVVFDFEADAFFALAIENLSNHLFGARLFAKMDKGAHLRTALATMFKQYPEILEAAKEVISEEQKNFNIVKE
jgi:hypothetical protein